MGTNLSLWIAAAAVGQPSVAELRSLIQEPWYIAESMDVHLSVWEGSQSP